MDTHRLNVAQICPVSSTLGPGRRFVIWVQGCPFSCCGCISPDWIEFREANLWKVSELAKSVLRLAESENLEGITISGGEPTMQAAALVELLDLLRNANPSFSAVLFSGYTLAQLQRKAETDKDIAALLMSLDILIDGLYIEARNDSIGLRGSSNQQIHFLTERYSHLAHTLNEKKRDVELHLLDGEILLVGVPTQKFLNNFHMTVTRIKDSL